MSRKPRRAVVVVVLVAATALVASLALGSASGPKSAAARSAKLLGDPDANQSRALPGSPSRELRGPAFEAEQAIADRAYPAKTLLFSLQKNALEYFNRTIRSRGNDDNGHGWQLAGPSTATVPAILNRSNADYVTSGRITALAIAPTCVAGDCRVWVGAAGGGVWRTNDALAAAPSWKFVSGSFASNAIGTLTYDAAHNTLFAGTGEPNAGFDSEAGVGIYKSTDGGTTWSLLPGSPAATNARAISSVVLDPRDANTIYVGTARGVRGISSVVGGGVSFAPDAPPWGLYKSTDGGQSFSMVWDGNASARGINHVEVDRNGDVYAAAFQAGIWRSRNGGGTWEQVFATQDPGENTARTEFALAATLDHHTRIYVGDGGTETGDITPDGATYEANSGVYRADSVDTKPAATLSDGTANPGYTSLTSWDRMNPGYATYDYCWVQCWYDNFIVSPPGHPDVVYVGGAYDYNFTIRSNGKAVLLSQDAGATWTDQTKDAVDGSGTQNGLHPDQHALAVSPSNPLLFFEGSDGGLVRSSGQLVDRSAECDARPLGLASRTACKNMLKAIPTKLTGINAGLSTLQFMSVNVNPANPKQLLGGTQDNGTWQGIAGDQSWPQTIWGDGGQSGFDVGKPNVRFNNFYSPYTDANFQGGDPTKWVVISGPLFDPASANQKENASFYLPEIGDPVVSGTMYLGMQHVWRTTDNGGDPATLEANCPEFTTSGAQQGCGDYVPLGDPSGFGSSLDHQTVTPGDLTSTLYGADRSGDYVVATTRAQSDRSTLWAATRTGRVFVSRNADAVNPAAVTFTRIDSLSPGSPGRFVSEIVIDDKNANHVWISYSGYNANTPNQPGHVFEVTYDPKRGTATWTNLDRGTGPLGDLPVTDLVRDPVTNRLYAATDFGVLTQVGRSGFWTSAASGIPVVTVSGLTLDPKSRVLYAATHGRAIWSLKLRDHDDNSGQH